MTSDFGYLLGTAFFADQPDPLKKLYQVLEASFDGIYITDGEANTLFANHSYELITGLNRMDMLGKNMRDLMAAKTIDKSGTLLVLASRKSVTLEQKFSTGKRAIISSTPTYDDTGNIVMVVTNVRDITELYELKEQLAKKEDLTQQQLREIELIRQHFGATHQTISVDSTMLQKLLLANRVAKLDTIVLLLGETGVGKEVVANYIHQCSTRSSERFIKINCGSIAKELAESEFFGYERGAFTGANTEGKPGIFEIAHKGTLFLDEVGELPMEMQVKLLRVIQEKEVLRVGGRIPKKVDVRIIAATNRDLESMVRQKRFRSDLFYRLNVFPLVIPPLRERSSDIPLLASSILEELNKKYGLQKELSIQAKYTMQGYAWPGNIRELRNAIERAIIVSTDNEIRAEDLTIYGQDLPAVTKNLSDLNLGAPIVLKQVLEDIEAEYIKAAYEKHKNLRRAAAAVSMDPATFLRKRNKYFNNDTISRNNETECIINETNSFDNETFASDFMPQC
jgi:PAS domain S-box-containing protein